jgi:hypothetical protein
MHKASRDAFLSILLNYRENKEFFEPILLHQTLVATTSLPAGDNGGYVEVPEKSNHVKHAKTFVEPVRG